MTPEGAALDVSLSALSALGQVLLADLVLAGDNAVAVGLAAAGLPEAQRRRAILYGILAALVLRIAFALIATQLLQIPGLLLAGGLLLFWVAYKMWRDIAAHTSLEAGLEHADSAEGTGRAVTFAGALTTIIMADVSMSLDNVLVVAAVARDHPTIMAIGLVMSVVLMGVAASVVAGLIQRYRWIAYVGVAVIVFAAIRMVWEDGHHLLPAFVPAMPSWLGAHGPPAH